MEYLPSYKDSLYLEHHGILGQRWGVRRFQNKDGSYTDAGRKRYGVDVDAAKKKLDASNDNLNKVFNSYGSKYTDDDLSKAIIERDYSKNILKSEKIKDKINKQGV